jgi:hypothetical protein
VHPPTRRGSVRAPALIGALLVALATACTSSGGSAPPPSPSASSATATPVRSGQTYRDHGVSFSYPAGWRQMRLADSSASTGTFDWTATVGIDSRNLVNVSRSTIGTAITPTNISAKTGSITLQIRSLFTQAGGSLSGGPEAEDVAGLPALRYAGDARTPAGRSVHTRLVLVFAGTTEYAVACQYDDRVARQMLAGCDQVVSTLSVQG